MNMTIFIVMPNLLMDTFFGLNREKLRFVFARTSLIFMGLVSILLAIAYFTGNFPNTELLFIILLIAGIGCPVFIILISYLTWLHKRSARKNTFSKAPFNQIYNIGFYNFQSNGDTKWLFTELVKKGIVNGFTLVFDISGERNHIINVQALTEYKKLDKDEYHRLSEIFKRYDIEFRVGSIVKGYNTKRSTVYNIDELKMDLEKFTELLKEEGFEPQKVEGWA